MKKFFAAIALGAFLAPAIAFAQTASPAPSGPPMPPGRPWMHPGEMNPSQMMIDRMAAMQLHLQMAQLRRQTRAQLLAALTPAHRTLLQTTIGQLALADNPDRKAAAARLDAALSPGEKAAILRISADAKTKRRALMDNFHRQMLSQMPADVRAQAERLHAQMQSALASRPKRPPDPGRILLAMAGRGEEHEMFGRHHRGFGMHGGMMGPWMMGPGMGPGMMWRGRRHGPDGLPTPPPPVPTPLPSPS